MTDINALRQQVRQLQKDLDLAKVSLWELNRTFQIYLGLMRRTGLNENIVRALSDIQRITIAIQTAYRAALLLSMATSPLGFVIGAGALIASSVAAASAYTDFASEMYGK